MLNSYGEAKEVTRLPGRTPGLVVRQALRHRFIRRLTCAAKPFFAFATVAKQQGAHAAYGWRVKQCGFTAVGTSRVSARRPTRFLLRQKVGQKGDPYDGAPLRGVPASPAPEPHSSAAVPWP